MIRLLTGTCIALALTVALHAQSPLVGKWEGVNPMGAPVLLDLAVKEATLEGTLTRGGETGKIVDGKIVKNTFTFRATVGTQTGAFSGEIDKDQISVWLDHLGRENATVLTRVKKVG